MSTTESQPVPPRKRRWLQFSLRTLLVLMLLASIGMSWVAVKMQKAKRQREAVMAITILGGEAVYDCRYRTGVPQPAGPTWLRSLLGEDLFNDVVFANVSNGRGMEYVGAFGELQDLFCHDTTDAGLEHIKGLNRLEWLHLSGTKVTDAGLEHIKGLTQLQELYLNDTKVTDAGLEHIKTLSQLQLLDLGDTEVTDAGLEHIKGLTQLQMLNLDSTKVTDAGLEHIKGLNQLQMLSLGSTKVTDAGLEHLKGLTHLQLLNLDSIKVTNAGAAKLQQALPNCKIER